MLKNYAAFAAALIARFSLFLSRFTFSIFRSAFHFVRIFFRIPIWGYLEVTGNIIPEFNIFVNKKDPQGDQREHWEQRRGCPRSNVDHFMGHLNFATMSNYTTF